MLSPSVYKKHVNTAELIVLPTMKTIPTKEGIHCDKQGQCFELMHGDSGTAFDSDDYEARDYSDYQETNSPKISDQLETEV